MENNKLEEMTATFNRSSGNIDEQIRLLSRRENLLMNLQYIWMIFEQCFKARKKC
jgi:hypothetical protein